MRTTSGRRRERDVKISCYKISTELKLERRRRTRVIDGRDPVCVPGSTAVFASTFDIHASSFSSLSPSTPFVVGGGAAVSDSSTVGSPWLFSVGRAAAIVWLFPGIVRFLLAGANVGSRDRGPPEIGVTLPEDGNGGGDVARVSFLEGIFDGVGRVGRWFAALVPERVRVVGGGSSRARRAGIVGSALLLLVPFVPMVLAPETEVAPGAGVVVPALRAFARPWMRGLTLTGRTCVAGATRAATALAGDPATAVAVLTTVFP